MVRISVSRMMVILALLLLACGVVVAQDSPLITMGESDTLGPYLANAEGMTLYTFDRDTIGTSNCVDRCAENWPALTVESEADLTAAEGIPGAWGTTERADGTLQVTYNGWPLYTWARDEAAGDTTGHRVGRVWWIASPATVSIGGNEELGRFLVGPQGMTLYLFLNDEPGVSNCTGDCLTNWPALTVESEDAIVPGVNLVGELGTIEREDGALQVTYNGWPLYYFANDAAIGDATGQGRGEVWYVVKPETVGVSSTDELGEFLTSADGMTLYTFKNDEPGVSNCADECLEAWPPLTVSSADALAAPEGLSGELGTIEREDGALQVTYNGWPVYFWQGDAAPGDTTGQGVGDVWFVASTDTGM
jgi:predicted lipoprotein with Yx(FWY)xxD motif